MTDNVVVDDFKAHVSGLDTLDQIEKQKKNILFRK
jgi:hypothetical protein